MQQEPKTERIEIPAKLLILGAVEKEAKAAIDAKTHYAQVTHTLNVKYHDQARQIEFNKIPPIDPELTGEEKREAFAHYHKERGSILRAKPGDLDCFNAMWQGDGIDFLNSIGVGIRGKRFDLPHEKGRDRKLYDNASRQYLSTGKALTDALEREFIKHGVTDPNEKKDITAAARDAKTWEPKPSQTPAAPARTPATKQSQREPEMAF